MKPIMFIFSGLPGSGKTSIATEIAKSIKAVYLRLDTIEHGLTDICKIKVGGEGYRLTYRIAADNLKIGNNVVIDCVNPWEMTRKEWNFIAISNNAEYMNIEIKCSNMEEHKKRNLNRISDIDGFIIPTWDEIIKRYYQEWKEEHIVIETANKELGKCIEELKKYINVKDV